jgi:hypothetical protein
MGQRLTTWAAAATLFLVAWWPVRRFVADDTYIHLTYARNLIDGLGMVFNPGEHVYGSTSPLWTLIIALLGTGGADLLRIAQTLSVGCGLAAVVATSIALEALLSRVVVARGASVGIARLAWTLGTVAFALDVWLVRWSASGMETSLAVFLVSAGFAADFRTADGDRASPITSWAWGLATLVRPEIGLLVVLVATREAASRGPIASRVRRAGRALLPAALMGGAWLAYAASFYGTLVPSTLAAKAANPLSAGENLVLMVKELLPDRLVEMVACLIALPVLLRSWSRRLTVVAGWLALLPAFYALSRVAMNTRYLLLLVPVIAVLGWAALAVLASRLFARSAAGGRALIAAAAVTAVGANLVVLARYVVPQAHAFEKILTGSMIPTARWFRAHTPPGTRVAIPHIGVFGYYSGRTVVDMGGLVTPRLIPLLARGGYDRVITEFSFAGIVHPDYLVDVDTESRRLQKQCRFAPCLALLAERPFDFRSLQHPEPAFLTVYRVDWACYERRAAGPTR